MKEKCSIGKAHKYHEIVKPIVKMEPLTYHRHEKQVGYSCYNKISFQLIINKVSLIGQKFGKTQTSSSSLVQIDNS